MRHQDAESWEPLMVTPADVATVGVQVADIIRNSLPDPPIEPTGRQVTMPCPPGLDPEKWATLDRRTRRALWRHHRKVERRG